MARDALMDHTLLFLTHYRSSTLVCGYSAHSRNPRFYNCPVFSLVLGAIHCIRAMRITMARTMHRAATATGNTFPEEAYKRLWQATL